MNTITVSDLERAWHTAVSPWVANRIQRRDLRYREISDAERDAAIIASVNALTANLVVTGRHRSPDWERGWQENLNAFNESKDIAAITPRYFSKLPLLRWNQRWILPSAKTMEYDMLGSLLDWVFDQYLAGHDSICEFGCGTGHNLLRVRERYPDAALWGLDWATSSQELISQVAAARSDSRLRAARFDYFNPDHSFTLGSNAAVFTVASLEQIGAEFQPFVNYLLEKRPRLVVHVEPIEELLDPENLLDALSIRYFHKRKYLSGYLDHLRQLEANGSIRILKAARSYVGSFFIDGYSVLVWTPSS